MTSFGDVVEINENDNPIMLEVPTPSPLISPTDSNNSVSATKQENPDTITLSRNFKGNPASDEFSSTGSSLTELKRFLRDLPPPNEIAQLTDRVAALKRRDRDVCLHLQDSASRIEETDEKEEVGDAKDAVLETETPANNFPKAVKSRDARARRRARIQAGYSQGENKEMVLTQRDSTSAADIIRREKGTTSNKSTDGPINKLASPHHGVNLDETMTLVYPNETGLCVAWDIPSITNDYHEVIGGKFHADTVTTHHIIDQYENSQKKEEIYLTQVPDTSCHNYQCECTCKCSLQGIALQLSSPLSSDCNQSTRYDGYRPKGVTLKNLSSESETDIKNVGKNNSGRPMNDLELSSPPSKLQRDAGNMAFVSARSEPTNSKVLQSPCSYMGNESTARKGFIRELSLESLRTSRYQPPNKRNYTADIGATKPIQSNLTKQFDDRNQRLGLISLQSRNNQEKESGVITSRSMGSEIFSVPQAHHETPRKQLHKFDLMTDMQVYKEMASSIEQKSSFCANKEFKDSVGKVPCTSTVDRGLQNTVFHLHTNGKITSESSKDMFKGVNDTRTLQSEFPINALDSCKELNETKLPDTHAPFNSLKSPAGRTKIPVKIKESRNKNLVNTKEMKDNHLSSSNKNNSSLVTLKETLFATDRNSLEDTLNSTEKRETCSARLYSNQRQIFSKLSNTKASTVPNSPSDVRDNLFKNIRCFKNTTLRNRSLNQRNQPQSKVNGWSRVDNAKCSDTKPLTNIANITCDNVTEKSHQNNSHRSGETEYNILQSPIETDNCKAFAKSKYSQENENDTNNNDGLKYKSDETLVVEDLEGSVLESDVESSKTDQTSSDKDQSEYTTVENSPDKYMKDAEREDTVQPLHLRGCNDTCQQISEEVRKTEDTIITFHKAVKKGAGELSPKMKSLSTATICISSRHSMRDTKDSVTYSNEDSSTSANVYQCKNCVDNVSAKDFQFEVNIGDSNIGELPRNVYNIKHTKIQDRRTFPRSAKIFSGFYQPSKRKESKCEKKVECDIDNLPKIPGKCMADNRRKNVNVEFAKPISSDTTAFFVHGTRKLTAPQPTMFLSTSKLVSTDDAVKNSPRTKRKSQDRFPFTISKATSTMSSKFKSKPECDRSPNFDRKSTPREGTYRLDVHPSIMRLACKGFEETGYDVMKCVTYDREIQKKKILVPMMKGFVRKFSNKLRVKSKRQCPSSVDGTMQVIYKNKQCREESLENTSSNQSLKGDTPKNLKAANKPTNLHWLPSDSTDSKSSTGSSKILRKAESRQHIALNLEELSTRHHHKNAWIQDITDQETSPQDDTELWTRSHGSSGMSTNHYSKENSKRHSVFLVTNSRHTQTPECPQVTSIAEQDEAHSHKYLPMWKYSEGELANESTLPEDINTRGKEKRASELYINELEGVETGCFCLRFCHLVARFSTGTMSKNRISVRQGTSSSRVNRYRLPLWKSTR